MDQHGIYRIRVRLAIALAVGTFFSLPQSAFAQKQWPVRPITVLVAAGPGSSVDNYARIFCEKLGKELGQPIIVDNRPGGNGVIGARAAASASPDGYTYLFAGNSVTVMNMLTMLKPGYTTEKDFSAVGTVVALPFVIAVPSTDTAKSLKELIDRAKQKELFFATPGSTSISRLIGEWLNQKTGSKLENLAYPSSMPAQTDVISGRVPVLIDAFGSVSPQIKAGRLRALAISSPSRLKDFPEIPTIAETIPGFVVPGVLSLMAPAGTPVDILEKVATVMKKIAQDPAIVEKYANFGGVPVVGERADVDLLFREQRALFGELMQQANIKPE